MDYSKTLHLPETEFPMRGNLPKKEPGFVEFWQQNHLYEKRIEKRKKEGAPTFVLHDGPPYANGKIHIGHALNKTLKDIIVRYHHMAGNEVGAEEKEHTQCEQRLAVSHTPRQHQQSGNKRDGRQSRPGLQQPARRLHPVVIERHVGRQWQQDLPQVHA